MQQVGLKVGSLQVQKKTEKMDCEMLQQIQRYMEPETYATTPDHIALKYITVVGNDGHFVGIQHT